MTDTASTPLPADRDLISEAVRQGVLANTNALCAIVETVTSCNLACTYCFAGRPVSTRMPPAIGARIVEQVLRRNGPGVPTKFIWHGGEPLMRGIPFYEEMLAVQRRLSESGYESKNSIQTNATLLTDEWTDFLRDNEFGVGSSVDGTAELHDRRRRTRRDEATYDRVISNILRARDRGLNIAVICVVDQDSIPWIDEIYRNFKRLNLHFSISPVTPNHGQAETIGALTPEEYTSLLRRIFDLWFDDAEPTVKVNPPHSVLQGLLYGGISLSCSSDASCFEKFVSFLPDGSAYPCNRFAAESGFRLGSIVDQTLDEILAAEPRQRLLGRTTRLMEPCATCSASPMCLGGCAHQAFGFYGDAFRPDYYCRSFFDAFAYYRGRLNAALREASLRAPEDRGKCDNRTRA